MKPDIHPDYQEVVFHDTSADVYFVIGSTLKTDRTIEYKGKTYPYLPVEISSASHPQYTGKQRVSTQEGRIARFNSRFGKMGSK